MMAFGAIAAKLAPAALGAASSLFGRNKAAKAAEKAQRERIKFMREQMNRTYNSTRGFEGFGSTKDTLTPSGRTEEFTFAPALQSYINKQGAGLSNLPSFGSVQDQVSSMNAGFNPFYNLAQNVRGDSYNKLLGALGTSMFNRGLGNSSIMAQGLSDLVDKNADATYRDKVNALTAQQGFNTNAQNSMLTGMNNMFNYAQGLRGDTMQQRGQMASAAAFQPAFQPQAAGNVASGLGSFGMGLGGLLFSGALNKKNDVSPVSATGTLGSLVSQKFNGLGGLPSGLSFGG